MPHETFIYRSRVPAPAERVYEWHARAGAIRRLTPDWAKVRIVRPAARLADGERAELSVSVGLFRWRWLAEHRDVRPAQSFRDVQVAGPFAQWEHTHTMTPDGEAATLLEDRVEYALPLGRLGRLLGGRAVRIMLQRLFVWRHRRTIDDLRAHGRFRETANMRVLVTGSSGLIGSDLVSFLTTGGHEVVRLVRRQAHAADEIAWQPSGGAIDRPALEGFDAVVHLAGENIAGGRWTAKRKARIRSSRVEGTRLLAEALAGLEHKPRVLVCASAIGYYGDRGSEVLDESSSSGDNFLAEVCREWEAAAEPARQAGIRTVHTRFGVVLSAAGGALKQMLTPFKLGAGGKIGSGRQYWSWVAIDDVVGAIHHALMMDSLDGPINVTAPQPVTNREFTKTLGRVLHRPTLLPLPGFAARLALGEMADELLLASARVVPQKLQDSGYEFRYTDLEAALRHALGRD
ncbi:MAG: TIGR01777 family oxidoreductase [Planctomycetes bacterium]|nr:TIGR01777 family oxidoreductase [Planctomycetota bacterium]